MIAQTYRTGSSSHPCPSILIQTVAYMHQATIRARSLLRRPCSTSEAGEIQSIAVPGCQNGRFYVTQSKVGRGTSESGEPRARLRKIFWYQDAGYPVHRCVRVSVYMCISVSRGVPECTLGVKIVTFWVTPGPLKKNSNIVNRVFPYMSVF